MFCDVFVVSLRFISFLLEPQNAKVPPKYYVDLWELLVFSEKQVFFTNPSNSRMLGKKKFFVKYWIFFSLLYSTTW